MITAVFLDLYGTLAHFQPPREEVQAQACRSFGIKVTRDGLVRGYAQADEYMGQENAGQQPLGLRTPKGLQSFFAEYEKLILTTAGVDVDLEAAGKIWTKVQQIPHSLALFDDVLPTLDMLMLKGLTLGVLSNITRDMDVLSREMGLEPYLDFTITSGEIGAGKPHPLIFLAALERAGVESHEALHVGDSYSSDIMGARGVGIRALLLDRDGLYSNVTDCPRIGSLMEVAEYL